MLVLLSWINYFLPILCLVALIFALRFTRKAFQRRLAFEQEHTRLLKEILEELKRGRA